MKPINTVFKPLGLVLNSLLLIGASLSLLACSDSSSKTSTPQAAPAYGLEDQIDALKQLAEAQKQKEEEKEKKKVWELVSGSGFVPDNFRSDAREYAPYLYFPLEVDTDLKLNGHQQLLPNETLSLSWNIILFHRKGVEYTDQKNLIDTKLYLSYDDKVDDNDLLLKAYQANLSDPSARSDGFWKPQTWTYFPNNQNAIRVGTSPSSSSYISVDTSGFLTSLPLKGYILLQVCTRNDSNSCISDAVAVQFN